jgi:gamma-glutamyltranspeptidase/glutathione hydrolase
MEGMSFTRGNSKTLVAYLKKRSDYHDEDLAKYEAKWRNQLVLNKDLNIISMAPPSSGGICLCKYSK